MCDHLQDLVPCTLNNLENMGNAKIVENKAKKRRHIEYTSSFFNAVIGNLCHRFSRLFSVQGARYYQDAFIVIVRGLNYMSFLTLQHIFMNNRLFSDVAIDTWVQGEAVTAEDLAGSVVLIEVFQVNCPGCFMHALPQAIQLHEKYKDQGLVTIGLATAFEDYDKNTLENLQLLVKTGEVIGETRKALNQYNLLNDNKLEWNFPFAVGMDRVVPETEPITDERILRFIHEVLPTYGELREDQQQAVRNQVKNHFAQKTMKAETFEYFSLQGTPSAILFDRQGQLKDVSFGQMEHLSSLVEQCLAQ